MTVTWKSLSSTPGSRESTLGDDRSHASLRALLDEGRQIITI